ncbi:hypothetical protein E6C27_scaffold46360G00010 [Cucumis melo var. makuwa]|uniref:Uncharacterized protein n=1 Tax=Cucumis melo var. makuwa TaxID=1194695 RepID=A0A5A7TZP9_CUCMM|nr:hypothetical protein E6C27_scaffold46360G00010 [Cucumis melo var. makuwa]
MEIFAFGMKMDEQALEPGTDEIPGMKVPLKRPKEGGDTCNKAQANTSRPEEARLRLPDPGHTSFLVQQHESGIERSDDFEWLNMKIKPILRTDESTGRSLTAGMGSDPSYSKHSTTTDFA